MKPIAITTNVPKAPTLLVCLCLSLTDCNDGGDVGGGGSDGASDGGGGGESDGGSDGGSCMDGDGGTGGGGGSGNLIEVPQDLLGDITDSGPARCKRVDLQSVPVPPNPGYGFETVDSQTICGDELWKMAFYTMLYSNCERQARGLTPFRMYPAEKMVAMQETVKGISEPHEGFGDRTDIAGGGGAEGHGGGPLPGATMGSQDYDEDDDNNQ